MVQTHIQTPYHCISPFNYRVCTFMKNAFFSDSSRFSSSFCKILSIQINFSACECNINKRNPFHLSHCSFDVCGIHFPVENIFIYEKFGGSFVKINVLLLHITYLFFRYRKSSLYVLSVAFQK